MNKISSPRPPGPMCNQCLVKGYSSDSAMVIIALEKHGRADRST
jgi:hypothetical protein